MKYLSTISLLALTAGLAAAPLHAHAQSKWGAHVEAEGKWGTERSLGELGLFIPIWQNDTTLAFTDLRGRLDDNGSQEGNFGLGVRHQLNSNWAVGGYAFYDRRRTPNDNYFHQGTIGLEALTKNFELRSNIYIPESTEKLVGGSSGSGGGGGGGGSSTTEASVAGGNFQLITTTIGAGGSAAVERALPGADIEAGYKFDLPGNWEAWGYAGAFHFNADGYNSVTGPRGRIELSYNNVPYLGEDSKFTLGFETQTDTVRGSQSWGIARLRIPLNRSTAKRRGHLSELDKRMTTRIVRDIDIVSQEGEASGGGGSETTVTAETATVTLDNGVDVTSYTELENGDDIPTEVTNAGANSLIVLKEGTIDTAATINMNAGQVIMSGGETLTLTGNTSGLVRNATLPGSRATINNTNVTNVIETADNAVIKNINTDNGFVPLRINGDNNIIDGVNMTNTFGSLSVLNGSDNLSVSNFTIDGGGINLGSSDNATFTNVTVSNAFSGVIFNAGQTINNPTFTNVTFDTVTFQIIANNITTTVNNPSGALTSINGSVACNNPGTINGSTMTINGVACP